MAFVNAYLTEEEKEKFNEAKIPDPRWNLPKYCLEPWKWTVDKDRGIALINCGVADRENYKIETFAFINTQIEKHQTLSFEIINKSIKKEEEEELKKKYDVDCVEKWELIDIHNLKISAIVSSIEGFVELLSEALNVYGINGKINSSYNVKALLEVKCGDWNMKIKIINEIINVDLSKVTLNDVCDIIAQISVDAGVGNNAPTVLYSGTLCGYRTNSIAKSLDDVRIIDNTDLGKFLSGSDFNELIENAIKNDIINGTFDVSFVEKGIRYEDDLIRLNEYIDQKSLSNTNQPKEHGLLLQSSL